MTGMLDIRATQRTVVSNGVVFEVLMESFRYIFFNVQKARGIFTSVGRIAPPHLLANILSNAHIHYSDGTWKSIDVPSPSASC